ncbi:DUF4874 domain-containing protein [Nonomuraea sp. B10E15]|uniref:DUF4874 domain-containing protein n=1 Tax=Nonomuraea sp. B10E15 TaxID=3153560 RepID=UPI00325D0004
MFHLAEFRTGPISQAALAHLDRLDTYLRANEDVIYLMQAGFIGAWSEQNFGDQGVVSAADRAGRKAVVDKILAVLPSPRMAQREISRRLGYRSALRTGAYPDRAARGGALPVTFTVRNDGYAAPVNPSATGSELESGLAAVRRRPWRGRS